MEKKTAGLLGILIAVSALLHPVAAPSTTPGPAPEEKKPVQAALIAPATCDASEMRGPWEAVRALFIAPQSVSSPYATPVTERHARQPNAALRDWGAVPRNTAISFLVVAVADPEQTHLALNFDRVIESIIWSTGDAGYVFDRYWIPWTTAPAQEALTQADEECRRKLKLRRHREPGLMIFRHRPVTATDAPHFLFVWLVGEAPTLGIDKWEFQNAITYTKQLEAYAPAKPGSATQVRLVGPNFSGSLDLLATDIPSLTALYPNTHFYVISGVATNYEAISRFKTLPNIHYESTIENDKRASELFFNYVASQWRHWGN